MKAVYKWRITNNKYVYITDSDTYYEPFIYNTLTGKRTYKNHDDLVSRISDNDIKNIVAGYLKNEYCSKFTELCELLKKDNDGKLLHLLDCNFYYDENGDFLDDCSEDATEVECNPTDVIINATLVNIEHGEKADVDVIKDSVYDPSTKIKTDTFNLKFYLPESKDGRNVVFGDSTLTPISNTECFFYGNEGYLLVGDRYCDNTTAKIYDVTLVEYINDGCKFYLKFSGDLATVRCEDLTDSNYEVKPIFMGESRTGKPFYVDNSLKYDKENKTLYESSKNGVPFSITSNDGFIICGLENSNIVLKTENGNININPKGSTNLSGTTNLTGITNLSGSTYIKSGGLNVTGSTYLSGRTFINGMTSAYNGLDVLHGCFLVSGDETDPKVELKYFDNNTSYFVDLVKINYDGFNLRFDDGDGNESKLKFNYSGLNVTGTTNLSGTTNINIGGLNIKHGGLNVTGTTKLKNGLYVTGTEFQVYNNYLSQIKTSTFTIDTEYGTSIRKGGLTVTGNVVVNGNVNGTAFYETSDTRKKDIKEELSLEKCYDLIDKCSTIIFNWKGDITSSDNIGVIAQEIKEIFPEIVNSDTFGYLSVDYSKLSVICMRVLKDIINRIKKLENK